MIPGLASCIQYKKSSETQMQKTVLSNSDKKDTILTTHDIALESPMILKNSDYILIPVEGKNLYRRRHEGKFKQKAKPKYCNIVFYNRETKESHFFTRDRMDIRAVNVLHNRREIKGSIYNGKILYEIITTDYHEDGTLNGLDPEYLFVSDFDGSNLIQISPDNEDLLSYIVTEGDQKIIFRTRRDSDQDSLYNRLDETVLYIAELKNENWKVQEMVNKAERDTLRTLYFKYWLEKDEEYKDNK